MAQKCASPWFFAGATGGITDAISHALVAGIAASGNAGALRQFLSAIQFANKSATASEITILDGATVIWRGYAAASAAHAEEVNFDPPLQSSPGNALNVAMVTTATATIVSAQGFTDA